LFGGIMLLSAAYFIKVIIKPSYKSEVVMKSKFLRKDVFQNILEFYNADIHNDYEKLNNEFKNSIINSKITKFETTEIKPDITSPDKDDKTKYYRFTMLHSQKPPKSSENDFKVILNDIRQKVALDHDVTIGREKTEEAISELDSLLQTALPAGNSFKNRIDAGTSMLIMNDLYKSLNDLLARQAGLKTELRYFQTENLIFQVSPIVLSKKISFPMVIFVIGFAIWFFICAVWVGSILVFGEDE
jgi:hypothetical protein